jgi:eukaryotic-like serine/threonine-protein kinase
MRLNEGSRLGNYEIVGLLGTGGMGEVYRARDPKLRREVAIKLVAAEFARDPERLARFSREAQLLASLNHRNIAAIYELEQADDAPFLVLELVEGKTLAERLAEGALSVREALEISAQIAEGLEAAHGKGIIHRDLKPANIKLTPDGLVKILDFGLAKEIPHDDGADPQLPTITVAETRKGVVLGTAPYMSPEQARGQAADERTDVWAFGCVLYELLTRQRAFPGRTTSDVMAAVLEREPDWRSLAQAPSRIRDLVYLALQKEPRRRLHDIADARIELEAAIRGDSTPWTSAAPHSKRGLCGPCRSWPRLSQGSWCGSSNRRRVLRPPRSRERWSPCLQMRA